MWNLYREGYDEANNNTSEVILFEHKTKTAEKTLARPDTDGDNNRQNLSSLSVEVTIQFRYLSTVWRSLDLVVISCEVELYLYHGQNILH